MHDPVNVADSPRGEAAPRPPTFALQASIKLHEGGWMELLQYDSTNMWADMIVEKLAVPLQSLWAHVPGRPVCLPVIEILSQRNSGWIDVSSGTGCRDEACSL